MGTQLENYLVGFCESRACGNFEELKKALNNGGLEKSKCFGYCNYTQYEFIDYLIQKRVFIRDKEGECPFNTPSIPLSRRINVPLFIDLSKKLSYKLQE